jgi:hypothetical protein
VGCLNLVQATIIYPLRVEGYDFEPVIMRMFEHDERTVVENQDNTKNYLILAYKDIGLETLSTLQDIYQLPQSKAQLNRLSVSDTPEISEYWLNRIKTEENLVVVTYYVPKELFPPLQLIMAQTGKVACDVSAKPGGDPMIKVWVSPKYQNICTEAQLID